MNFKVEFRYAVLTGIFMLLWLSLEFVAGFQDRLIAWYPYVSFLSIIIPIICYRLAFKEKIEKTGRLTFRQALSSGLVITIIVSLLMIPIQIMFLRFVNPDFLFDMIKYTIQTGRQNAEAAAIYFSPPYFLAEMILFTFLEGIAISLILAWKMQTVQGGRPIVK